MRTTIHPAASHPVVRARRPSDAQRAEREFYSPLAARAPGATIILSNFLKLTCVESATVSLQSLCTRAPAAASSAAACANAHRGKKTANVRSQNVASARLVVSRVCCTRHRHECGPCLPKGLRLFKWRTKSIQTACCRLELPPSGHAAGVARNKFFAAQLSTLLCRPLSVRVPLAIASSRRSLKQC